MTIQTINDGDLLGVFRGKANANFAELDATKLVSSQVLIKTNTTVYTPALDYHPATKLYADQLQTNWDTVYDPNNINADVFNRTNHTGTQLPSSIATDSGNRFMTDAERLLWNQKEDALGVKNTAFNKNFGTTVETVSEGNHIHTEYEAADPDISTHITQIIGNPHQVTKAEVGLPLADNTSDIDKPVSNAVNLLISNIDNTSDADKPVSDDTQTALDLKADVATTYTQSVLDAFLALKRDLTNFIFGDESGGDYSEFEANGTLKAIGGARTWDDLIVVLTGAELHPTQSPVWIDYKGSRALEFSGSAAQTIYFIAQLPHTWAEETDLEFHLHAIHEALTTGTVIWDFTHSWANVGDVFPTETTVQKVISTHSPVDEHGAGGIATLEGTGKKISSILLCSLTRRGDIDTATTTSILIGADFHHLIDTFGSRQEFIK